MGLCPITVFSLYVDPNTPPSSISPTPEEQVEVGTNISIQCWNQGYQGTISLHQGGHSAPVQHRNTNADGTAVVQL